MKLHPSTYLVILRGRTVATVSYLRGLLIQVTICTGIHADVAELMTMLPCREEHIARTEGIGLVPIEDLIAE
jgi:hypothetical protein